MEVGVGRVREERGALEHREPDRVPIEFGATPTSGMHVTCVAALREHLEDLLDPEIEAHLEQYSAWRERIRAAVTTPQAREQLWRELRAAGLYGVLRAEGPEVAGLLVDEGITRYADGSLTVEDSAP